ncbi:MAG: porin [Gammaproteobacteria bacterium]
MRADYQGTNFERSLSAWYTSLTWLMSGERYADSYKNGGFGRIKPKQNFVLLTEGTGAFELGVRYSQFDASGFTIANTAGTGQLKAGLTNEANAWTLGGKWILNPNARLMLNYVRTSFHTPVTLNGKTDGHEDALTMRAQLDF